MLWKKHIAICLAALLASTPLLNESTKAKKILEIERDNDLLVSAHIDNAMQSIEVNKLLIEDFTFSILEQPDLVGLEVMEGLPEQQQVMREHAELFLEQHKPKLIELNERSILVAEYMSLYNDYFVSEIEKVQEKKSSEQDARENIEAGLQHLKSIIEDEKAEVNDMHKEIEDFLVNLEEDYQVLETSVAKAEEHVIVKEGEVSSSLVDLNDILTSRRSKIVSSVWMGVGALLTIAAAGFFGRSLNTYIKASLKSGRGFRGEILGELDRLLFSGTGILVGGTLVTLTGISLDYILSSEIIDKSENLEGLNAELATVNITKHQVDAFVETMNSAVASLEDLTNAWDGLQSNVQIMTNDIADAKVNDLKTQFEEASVAWEKTKNASEFSRRLGENNMDLVEIDFDEFDTEEELKEALKEVYDADELIDIPDDLTKEELEELLLELLDEEMDEGARIVQ